MFDRLTIGRNDEKVTAEHGAVDRGQRVKSEIEGKSLIGKLGKKGSSELCRLLPPQTFSPSIEVLKVSFSIEKLSGFWLRVTRIMGSRKGGSYYSYM